MNTPSLKTFNSSDNCRSAQPLRHAKAVTFEDTPLRLEQGGELSPVTVCYETYGQLSPNADNAVLVCHALSGDSHVAKHDPEDAPGWWDVMIGPGRPIDTNTVYVICANVLGGCRGTTGPGSAHPKTGKPYGRSFPTVTIGDMVKLEKMLVDHLGISQLKAVVGGSMGGQQALCWGVLFPDMTAGVVALATAPRITNQSLAFDIVGRNAILHDPNFADGQYYDATTSPDTGLAIARMIGHVTYLSREAMTEKFDVNRYQPRDVATGFEKHFSVGSYLGYQGDKFVERFDANSYLALTKAVDLYDLGDSHDELVETFSASDSRWLVISFTSDWLYPPFQSQEIVRALMAAGKRVSYCNVASSAGHDAFLLEQDLPIYGELVRGFLGSMETGCCAAGQAPAEAPIGSRTIFRPDRLDHDRLIGLVPEGASVLDLGCGAGGLLCRLMRRPHGKLVGVDLSEEAIVASVANGHNVVHADLNKHLSQFSDGQFDYVVLSQTLQAVRDVEGLLAEMLRIGKHAVVSFPNFAYWPLRKMLAEEGKAPESSGLLRHKWYDTPNVRFFSIADFEDLCQEKDIVIRESVYLDTEAKSDVVDDPNLNADLAIFVLGGAPLAPAS
ncbi:MAG: homoserine O-acetyltransferase [Lentisphaerae bacterium]|jgi:homoserine O-acetyltransferase/O-succinyltransferase|nr:homoserine O-acetyltransferase [Lentisphaerota bacterium]MBT5610839.1 homoserine O-acetyltransferase [Lentisphaerota bacterium]MBT7053729.1 homoserine O-acetyltransferase [Lentisphaerota bacterium]MBT7841190.1 homoserine O-acetyltransferase [Lentisphaerota bacterium]